MDVINNFLYEMEHPNADMLIPQPSIYVYIPTTKVPVALKDGIPATQDKQLTAYFTRIPELEQYREFLDAHTPVRVKYSKLLKSKSQKIRLLPKNFNMEKQFLTGADIKRIASKNNKFLRYFDRGENLAQIPCISIYVESGVLPAFTFKVLDRELTDDI